MVEAPAGDAAAEESLEDVLGEALGSAAEGEPGLDDGDDGAQTLTQTMMGKAWAGEGPSHSTSSAEAMRVIIEGLTEEGERLQREVDADADPGTKFIAAIKKAFQESLELVKPGTVCDAQAGFPSDMDQGTREQVFAEFRRKAYDVEAVLNTCAVPKDRVQDVAAWMGEHQQMKIKTMVQARIRSDTLYKMYKLVPLEATCPKWWGQAIRRLSITCGLPGDGHVLAQVLRNQARFFTFPVDDKGAPAVTVQVLKSDTEWSMSGHFLHNIVLGKSSMGKDTLISIIAKLNANLQAIHNLPVNELKEQSYSLHGLIEDLEKLGPTFQIANIELEHFMKPGYLTEEDFTQVAEGKAFGKRVGGQKDISVKPNVNFPLIGTTAPVYVQRMGGDSNGRLRFSVTCLDTDAVLEVPLKEKFKNRGKSFGFVETLLSEAVRMQHAPLAQKEPGPGSPAIGQFRFAPGSAKLAEQVHDGTNKALRSLRARLADSVLATIIKSIGKASGIVGTTNTAIINMLLRAAFPEIQVDPVVRVEDYLAGKNCLDLMLAAQLHVEGRVADTKSLKRRSRGPDDAPGAPDAKKARADPVSPDTLQCAAARFLDVIMSDDPHGERGRLVPGGKGIRMAYKTTDTASYKEWRAMAQRIFRYGGGGTRYGDPEKLQDFYRAKGWRKFVQEFKDKKVLVGEAEGVLRFPGEAGKVNFDAGAVEYLKSLNLLEDTLEHMGLKEVS